MAKLMIIEDDQTSVKLLRILLEEVHGFEIMVARRGADVMPMLDAETEAPPDLFMVDYHLADMDGVELVQALRADARFAAKPIIVVSGLDVEHEAMKAGATKFLAKPYEPDDLADLFKALTD